MLRCYVVDTHTVTCCRVDDARFRLNVTYHIPRHMREEIMPADNARRFCLMPPPHCLFDATAAVAPITLTRLNII